MVTEHALNIEVPSKKFSFFLTESENDFYVQACQLSDITGIIARITFHDN